MRHFFLFICLLAAILLGTDFVITKLFDKLYERVMTGQTGGEINQYLSFPTHPKVLIMGNSRARYQVDPDSFAASTYSLCHAGMGQVFQTGLLQVIAKENKLPSTIILHVDFEEYLAKDNLEDIGNLRYYYRKIPSITACIDKISTFEKIKYLFQFYRYNGRVISTLKNFIQSRNYVFKGNGYQSLAPIANDSSTFIQTLPLVNTPQPHFYHQNLQHLESFISICKLNHVNLICFTSPYFSKRPSAAVAAFTIDSLLRARHIPYLNAVAYPLPVLEHHALFWQDPDHLNKLGAGYFSQQLAQWSKPFLTTDSI